MTRQMLGLAFAAACVFAVRPALAEDYVIGAELALTGTYAWVGVPSREGLDVGIEEVNASDLLGGHKLKVLIEDTGSDADQPFQRPRHGLDGSRPELKLGGRGDRSGGQ